MLLVSRVDADWCFLCGKKHPNEASFYKVVVIGLVVFDVKVTANEVSNAARGLTYALS